MLDDPNFDRSVVYMVEHHDEGALGLVLNRPSGEELVDPLEGWVSAQSEPSRVFSGGPVEPDALIALARTEHRVAAGSADDDDNSYLAPLTGEIASADLAADPALVIGRISALRVFRGAKASAMPAQAAAANEAFKVILDEPWRIECLARRHRDADVVEQLLCEFSRRPHTVGGQEVRERPDGMRTRPWA